MLGVGGGGGGGGAKFIPLPSVHALTQAGYCLHMNHMNESLLIDYR